MVGGGWRTLIFRQNFFSGAVTTHDSWACYQRLALFIGDKDYCATFTLLRASSIQMEREFSPEAHGLQLRIPVNACSTFPASTHGLFADGCGILLRF